MTACEAHIPVGYPRMARLRQDTTEGVRRRCPRRSADAIAPNEPNPGSRGGGDCGLEVVRCAGRRRVRTNEANLGSRGGCDWGLPIGDCGLGIRGGQVRRPPACSAKRSQSGQPGRLRIGDCGLEEVTCAAAGGAFGQTKPIRAVGAAAIGDCRWRIGDSRGATARWSSARSDKRSQSGQPGRMRLGIADCGLGIRGEQRRGGRRRVRTNEANFGNRGGCDWGLAMADWGLEEVRCAAVVGMLWQTKPIWATGAAAIGDCGLGIRRGEAVEWQTNPICAGGGETAQGRNAV